MNATDLLKWHIEAGADEAIGEVAVNRLEARPAQNQPKTRQAQSKASPAADTPQTSPAARLFAAAPAQAIAEARQLADAATSLHALEQAVRGFDGCALKRTATNTVFADGNPSAPLMLVGEAPGANEDIQGIPFCGVSGQLLDAMLAAIGIDRTSAYITNTVFWRPPGNRQPSTEETAICRPFVERHVALVKPKLLVLVGGTATAAMLGTSTGISRLRGKLYEYATPYLDTPVQAAVLFHPSYLLRQPAQKRLAWQDLRQIRSVLLS